MNRLGFLCPTYLWEITSGFIKDWWFNRHWSNLAYGSPALLVCLSLPVIWHYQHALEPRKLVDRYSKQILQAEEMADYDRAEICMKS